MPRKNLICLVVDRVHVGMLGAYGNSWIHTDHLDRLACESFVFDQALIESPQLDRFYQNCWLGARGTAVSGDPSREASLARLLRDAGLQTALITDEPEVVALSLAGDFSQQILVESPAVERPAEDELNTALARLFGTAAEWLRSAADPFCLWLHARGMAAAWDAPLELRNQYADEEDPQPPAGSAVPDRRLSAEYDPDELLGITHSYAGQISLLDRCVGALVERLRESALDASTLVTFLSPRGFPLGEHRRVGACDDALYSELAQIPCFMRFPDGAGKLARTQALVQPADLPGTMLDWLGMDRHKLGGGDASSLVPIVCGERDSLRDRVLMDSRQNRAIRTPAWLLRQPASEASELYAKPGDRWEVNEVAKLCPDIVAGLQAALAETQPAAGQSQDSPLAAALVTELD